MQAAVAAWPAMANEPLNGAVFRVPVELAGRLSNPAFLRLCVDLAGADYEARAQGASTFSGLSRRWRRIEANRGAVVRAPEQHHCMPRISELHGIVIEMFYDDHPPGHFHARYGGDEALVEIATGRVIAGSLPGRAIRLVREWIPHHRDDLEANWARAQAHEPLRRIAPLP